jgi:hypothetical protein
MQTLTISANIDIRAPRDQVWALIADIEKRMRLCELWDVVRVEPLTPTTLGVNSVFRLHIRHHHQDVERVTRVIEFVPEHRITHQRDTGASRTKWSVQDCAVGTRLMYEEIFQLDNQDPETFLQAAHQAAHAWLNNLKQYLEWRETRTLRAWRWIFDHAFLRVPASERRTMIAIVVMHVVGTIGFAAAAIAWGIAFSR